MSASKNNRDALSIAIRVNASSTMQEIATGHIVRCQHLARELVSRGHQVVFWTNQDPVVTKLLDPSFAHQEVGEYTELAPSQASLSSIQVLIVDFPAEPPTEASDPAILQSLSSRGIALIKLGHTGYISSHYAAVISLYPSREIWTSNYFEGPSYLVLNAKFRGLHQKYNIREKVQEAFVCMGGSDLHNLTARALRALKLVNFDGHATVILGAGNPHKQNILETIEALGLKADVLVNVQNIEESMLKADLAVTAFGTTAYELISLGVPTVAVSHYEWQADPGYAFAKLETMIFAGEGRSTSDEDLAKSIERIIRDEDFRKRFSTRGPSLIDHRGVERVADIIEHSAKPKERLDCLYVLAHPGDEVFACGGTILKQVAEGKRVGLAILGDGYQARGHEGSSAFWKAEQSRAVTDAFQKSIKELGVQPAYYYKLPDNQFDRLPLLDIVKIVEQLIALHSPVAIYTHTPDDLNIDHQIVYRAVITAARPHANSPIKQIFCAPTPSSTDWAVVSKIGNFTPNWFEEITPYLEKKQEIASCYTSELREEPHPRSLKGLEESARYWGRMSGFAACEPLELIRFHASCES